MRAIHPVARLVEVAAVIADIADLNVAVRTRTLERHGGPRVIKCRRAGVTRRGSPTGNVDE